MPRKILRVAKNTLEKSDFHRGNYNQLLERVATPTMNTGIRLLGKANRRDGVLSSLFPQQTTKSESSSKRHKPSTFQQPKCSTSQHPLPSTFSEDGLSTNNLYHREPSPSKSSYLFYLSSPYLIAIFTLQ